MIDIQSINTIYIKWEKDTHPVLILMINKQGTINRLGSEEDNKKPLMIMGKTDKPIFEHILENLDPHWLDLAGRYTYPNPKGSILSLTISMKGEEIDTGFSFTYGSQSEGPPEDIVDFVDYVVSLTEPWYEDQLTRKRQSK